MTEVSGCRKDRSLRSARGVANPHFVGRVGVGRQRRIRKICSKTAASLGETTAEPCATDLNNV